MRTRNTLWLVPAVLALVAAPVLAGDAEGSGSEQIAKVERKEGKETKKCPLDTQSCLNHMAAYFKTRGWVGIELDETAVPGGLRITQVEPDSPAKRAGLRVGDVLVAMNGIAFSEQNKEAMGAAHAKMTVGATVTYTVSRDGAEHDVPVKLEAIPDAVLAKWIGRHMLEHATVEVAHK